MIVGRWGGGGGCFFGDRLYYIALFSALLSKLIALACDSTRVLLAFYSALFEYPPKWCTYSAGMAGAT